MQLSPIPSRAVILAVGTALVLGLATCAGPRPSDHPAASRPANVNAAGTGRWVNLAGSTPGFVAESKEPATGAALTQIRGGDYIFFKNPDKAQYLQIKIDGDFSGSRECATYSGFECLGSTCQSRAIEPGGFVSLCFHDAGRFTIHVMGTPEPLRGIVEVVPR